MSDHGHSDDRSGYASDSSLPSSPSGYEDVDRARKAAEALFSPKRPIADPATQGDKGTAQQASRKPRILSAVREQQPMIQPHHPEPTNPSLRLERRRPRKRVPASHLARVRTWLNYGMTINQAADMYGVSVSEIERLLR
jgi:hypothetical protein